MCAGLANTGFLPMFVEPRTANRIGLRVTYRPPYKAGYLSDNLTPVGLRFLAEFQRGPASFVTYIPNFSPEMPRTEKISSQGAQGAPATSVQPYSVLKSGEPIPRDYRVTLCTSPANGYLSGVRHSGIYTAYTAAEATAKAIRHAQAKFSARIFAGLEVVRCVPIHSV